MSWISTRGGEGNLVNQSPIGVFDSGVGGLTVVRAIRRQLPDESIVYFGDTARFPYGPKPAAQLKKFVFEIIDYLLTRKVKLVVIACNSASSAGLEAAQAHFDVPVIGVVEPGARAAVLATRTRRIGVIGANATIESGAYDRAIHGFDAGAKVYSAVCPELADWVERGDTIGAGIEALVTRYLKPILAEGIDSLIMGCTHYPLLEATLAKVAGPDVALINSAEETARELKLLLTKKQILRPMGEPPDVSFSCSTDTEHFRVLGSRFLGEVMPRVEELVIGDAGEAEPGEGEPGLGAVTQRLASEK